MTCEGFDHIAASCSTSYLVCSYRWSGCEKEKTAPVLEHRNGQAESHEYPVNRFQPYYMGCGKEDASMKYQIQEVELPGEAITAAAVPNKDGSLTIYVNSLCSKEKQEDAMHDLLGRISAGDLSKEKRTWAGGQGGR